MSQPYDQQRVSARGLLARVSPYVQIARPDHWFKNVFMLMGVLLGVLYRPELFSLGMFGTIAWAVVAICLIASANYVINEILDAPTDRSHPEKRSRPIPSGQILLPVAYAEWILLAVAGIAMAAVVNLPFLVAGAMLLFMGLVYNVPPIRSKELPYVDVLSESVNNPLRLALGWFAVGHVAVPPMSLMLFFWMIGAFFMGIKRFAEYRSIADPARAASYRGSFRHYNDDKLLISAFFYATAAALFLGIFIIRYKLELILIIPLVAGFFSWYLWVALKPNSAVQAPERLYRERGLMAYLLLCLAAFLLLMAVEIPVLYFWFNVEPSRLPSLWEF